MNPELLSFNDIIGIIKRNLLMIFCIILLSTAVAFGSLKIITPKFKSKSILNIQASYFQIPLVSGLISEVRDANELKAQRSSLLRMALSDKFLDQLGEKYDIYKYPASHTLRPLEREFFLKRIEYISLDASTFQIAVTSKDSKSAYEMTKAVLDQMIDTLISERKKSLINAKTSIRREIEDLALNLAGNTGAVASGNPEFLKSKLREVESKIDILKSQYTSKHPEVVSLKNKAKAIRALLDSKKNEEATPSTTQQQNTDRNQVAGTPKGATQEVYNDLVKKLNYLNVVLEMEGDRSQIPFISIIEQPNIPIQPFFPKKPIVLLIGALIGLVMAAILTIYMELKRGTFISPKNASNSLGIPLLGILPILQYDKTAGLLTGPTQDQISKRTLPPPPSKE